MRATGSRRRTHAVGAMEGEFHHGRQNEPLVADGRAAIVRMEMDERSRTLPHREAGKSPDATAGQCPCGTLDVAERAAMQSERKGL